VGFLPTLHEVVHTLLELLIFLLISDALEVAGAPAERMRAKGKAVEFGREAVRFIPEIVVTDAHVAAIHLIEIWVDTFVDGEPAFFGFNSEFPLVGLANLVAQSCFFDTGINRPCQPSRITPIRSRREKARSLGRIITWLVRRGEAIDRLSSTFSGVP